MPVHPFAHYTPLDYRTYAVGLSSAALPAAAWYFLFYLLFVFSLAERKNEQKED
jgi:hypothetical protein